ncbi:MAG: PAS domain S-box protein [Campylobacterales bacterium]|nr:PAS domain S-box protein [Campylobacterales bacterium]
MKSEKGLTLIEPSYKSIFEYASLGIANIAPSGKFLNINKKFCDIVGYSREELLNMTFQQITHVDDLKNDLYLFDRVLKNKQKNYTIEKRCIHKDGTVIWVNLTVSLIRDEKNLPIYSISIIEDITQKKLIKLELEKKAVLFEGILELQPNIMILNDGKKIVNLNKKFFELFSEYKSLEEFLKEHDCICDFAEKYEAENYLYNIKTEQFLETISTEGEHYLLIRGRHFSIRHVKVDINEESIHIITLDEITSLINYQQNLQKIVDEEIKKRLEQEQILIQNSKLIALGEMLGAIAHQWRQPLNVIALISGSIQEILKDGFSESSLQQIELNLEKINQETQYLSATIDNFRNFFRQDMEKTLFNLKDMIENSINLIYAQFKSFNISINFYYDCQNCTFMSFKHEFQQVLLNILQNSKDSIAIKKDIDKDFIGLINISVVELKNKVSIKIEDNGSGIEDKFKNKIFEPYFTTKFQTRGTGLGLYITKIIIENHLKGSICLLENHNQLGGATFLIELNKEE